MSKDTIVFIDSGYLSIISKHFGKGNYIKIDYNQFAIGLARSQGLWCRGVYFYTAPPFQSDPPTPDEAERKSNYDKFVSKLNRIPNFVVREGRCQKVVDGYHQKGVDTLLTMDLFSVASNPKINTVIVLTCDTDFVPIFEKLMREGTEVILFFYNDYIRGSKFSMSNHILTACDKSVLLDMSYFDNCRRE